MKLIAPFLPLLLVTAACFVADAAEPAKKAEKEASPQRQFEGLGFSVAPPEGGKARTSLFGVVGEGYKFVYVLDRSGSMDGKPLRAVKEELIRSLSTLGSVHQFQIIFYNHQPTLLNPTGVSGRSGLRHRKKTSSEWNDSSIRSMPPAARITRKPSKPPSACGPT